MAMVRKTMDPLGPHSDTTGTPCFVARFASSVMMIAVPTSDSPNMRKVDQSCRFRRSTRMVPRLAQRTSQVGFTDHPKRRLGDLNRAGVSDGLAARVVVRFVRGDDAIAVHVCLGHHSHQLSIRKPDIDHPHHVLHGPRGMASGVH